MKATCDSSTRSSSAAGFKKFRPQCYLTDEWGCPDQQPVLGIPFYLADQKLRHLEKAVDALESERQIMMYMRHEAGHVFNYAYRLYTTPEWRRLFGPFFRAYRDDYRPVPFSKKYVRHIEGWYAQKHPDEDFAETFAVWLTPRSAWRRQYKGWPAMQKLRYVERVARAAGRRRADREDRRGGHHARTTSTRRSSSSTSRPPRSDRRASTSRSMPTSARSS